MNKQNIKALLGDLLTDATINHLCGYFTEEVVYHGLQKTLKYLKTHTYTAAEFTAEWKKQCRRLRKKT